MAQPIYYIPKQSLLNDKVIADAGLDYLIPRVQGMSISSQSGSGPDGDRGLRFSLGDVPVEYKADAQRWVKCDGGRFWIGYRNDDPPTPGELQRDRIVPGHTIELLDGNKWTVPLIRPLAGNSMLPRTIELDPETGEMIFTVKTSFAPVLELAERVFEQWLHDSEQARLENEKVDHEYQPGPIRTVPEWFDIAAAALAVNYRVSRWEILTLRLLDTDNVAEACGLMIDTPTISKRLKSLAAAAKKNSDATAPRGSGTSDGEQVDSTAETTSPPTQTSGSSPSSPTMTAGATSPPPSEISPQRSEPSPKHSAPAGGGDA